MNNKVNSKTEEKKLLKPKIDIVFQSLFSKENPEITKKFAEDILEEKIDSIVINEEKDLIRKNINDKLGILDLELEVNEKEKVDVEIQLVKRNDFIKRLMWYFAKLYGKQAKRGEEYEKIKKVVLVAIIDFEIKKTKDIKEMETVWKLIETKKRQKVLTDEIEIHIIEMKKAREMYERNKDNAKAQWIMFLNDPNTEEVKDIMEKNKGVKEAVVKVRELTQDEEMERLAFLREKAIMDEKLIREAGFDDGKEEGKKEGIELEKENMVKSMILNKLEEDKIKEIAKIDDKELNRIKKLLNNK